MRAALYARVSTKDQAEEGWSIDAQLRALRGHVIAQGWSVAGEYVDEGISAAKEASSSRPAFKRLLEDVEALYLVALAAGLRRGEVLALRWDDINFDTGSLAVRQSLSKVVGGWAFTEPKTAASRRVVKLPAFAVEALRVHRTRQLAARLASPIWADPALVFTTEIGTFLDGNNILKCFKGHVARAGMDPASFTFHGLRHSAATLMLALGVPAKVVAEALGHSRVGITLDTYTHVLPHLQEEAAARMDGLLAAR